MELFISFWLVALLFVGTIAVSTAIAVIITCILEEKEIWPYNGKYVHWPLVIAALLSFALGILAPSIYIANIMEQTEQIDSQHHSEIILERELCALNTVQKVKGEGNFTQILGTGSGHFVIESEDVYRYYYKSYHDRIWPDTTPMYESGFEYISQDETPKLIEYHDYDIETYQRKDTGEIRETEPLNEWYYYLFYVPEGSIVEEYNIN